MATNCCPGCSGSLVPLATDARLAKCQFCGGLVTLAPVPLDVACQYVDIGTLVDGPVDGRYFDLDVISPRDGTVSRTHGWFDPATKKVFQYG